MKEQKSEGTKEISAPVENPEKAGLEKEKGNADCQHFLGYLKKRPKGKSVPDECLTCNKMIECMLR
jgi:hypothetical protein